MPLSPNLRKNRFGVHYTLFRLQGTQTYVWQLYLVQSINFSREGLVNQLLNRGDVTVDTGSKPEVLLRNIWNPRRLQETIVQAIQRSKSANPDLVRLHRELVEKLLKYERLIGFKRDKSECVKRYEAKS